MKANLAVLGLFLCLAPAELWAQPVVADVSGKWMGTLDIGKPDGTVQHDTAYFIIRQDGDKLSGSAGPSERQQSPMTEGMVTASAVRFVVQVRPGTSVSFDLHLDGDHLRGDAKGSVWEANSTISVDTLRLRAASAGSPGNEEIFAKISGLDTRLFGAFNSRDLPAFETFFTRDVEFYHDKEGLTRFDQIMDTMRKHFSEDARTRRELVEGTLEVYPLSGYGAVELGVHRFYTTEKGQPEKLTATARFVHLWQEQDGVWKISRVISYDHR
jgi:hypothetical protein